MRHQLVRTLGRYVKGYGIIVHKVGFLKWYFLVSFVNETGRCIDEMLYWMISTCFQGIVETDGIALDIQIGMIDRIPYTSLSCQVDDDVWLVVFERLLHQILVSDIPFDIIQVVTGTQELRHTKLLWSSIIIDAFTQVFWTYLYMNLISYKKTGD